MPAVSENDVMFGFNPWSYSLRAQPTYIGYETNGLNILSSALPASGSTALGNDITASADLITDTADSEDKYKRIADPAGSGKMVGYISRASYQYAGNSFRSEMNYERHVVATGITPADQTYFWWAWRTMFLAPSWTDIPATALIAQFHRANVSGTVNPPFAVEIQPRAGSDATSRIVLAGRWCDLTSMTMVDQQTSFNQKVAEVGETGVWYTFILRARLDWQTNAGRMTFWRDGTQLFDYTGKFGYRQGTTFLKQGIYPLNLTGFHDLLLFRSAVVSDPNLVFTEPDLRAFIEDEAVDPPPVGGSSVSSWEAKTSGGAGNWFSRSAAGTPPVEVAGPDDLLNPVFNDLLEGPLC